MTKIKEKQQLRNNANYKARYKKRLRTPLVIPRVLRLFIAVTNAVVQLLRIAKQLYDMFR